MRNTLHYLGLTMAIIYLAGGLCLIAGPLVFGKDVFHFENPQLFGGLLIVYGSYRVYRYYADSKSNEKA